MKKLFISQPMSGKADEEILAERKVAIKAAEELLREPVEVIDSFFQSAPVGAKPLWFIGKSLEFLSDAFNDIRRVRDRADHALPNPPGGICRKFVAFSMIILICSPHEPYIAFLEQIHQVEPPVLVFLGNCDHEPQVSLDKSFPDCSDTIPPLSTGRHRRLYAI